MALYFRIILVLPLLFSALSGVISGAESSLIVNFSKSMMYVVGLPYIVFAIAAFVWSLRIDKEKIQNAFKYSPFVFGIIVFIYQFILDTILLDSQSSLLSQLGGWLILSLVATLICVFYTWSALLLWRLYKLIRQ